MKPVKALARRGEAQSAIGLLSLSEDVSEISMKTDELKEFLCHFTERFVKNTRPSDFKLNPLMVKDSNNYLQPKEFSNKSFYAYLST